MWLHNSKQWEKKTSRERNSSQWRLFNEEKKEERRLKSLVCVRVRVEKKSHQRIRFFNDGEEGKKVREKRNGFKTIRLVERQLVTSDNLQSSHMTRSDIEFRRCFCSFFFSLFVADNSWKNERTQDVLLGFFHSEGKCCSTRLLFLSMCYGASRVVWKNFHRK